MLFSNTVATLKYTASRHQGTFLHVTRAKHSSDCTVSCTFVSTWLQTRVRQEGWSNAHEVDRHNECVTNETARLSSVA